MNVGVERNAGHLEIKITALERDIEIQNETISQLQKAKDSNEGSINDLNRDTSELERVNKSLTNDIDILEDSVRKLKVENKALLDASNRLQIDYNSIKERTEKDDELKKR